MVASVGTRMRPKRVAVLPGQPGGGSTPQAASISRSIMALAAPIYLGPLEAKEVYALCSGLGLTHPYCTPICGPSNDPGAPLSPEAKHIADLARALAHHAHAVANSQAHGAEWRRIETVLFAQRTVMCSRSPAPSPSPCSAPSLACRSRAAAPSPCPSRHSRHLPRCFPCPHRPLAPPPPLPLFLSGAQGARGGRDRDST